jgi:arylsulfatase A-like enzyme
MNSEQANKSESLRASRLRGKFGRSCFVATSLRGEMSILIVRSIICCALAGCLLLAPALSVRAAPPNVLFLLADQWRAQAFGYAGDPNVQTPHLDRLQRESLWFRNAVAGVPVCCPTRASLMTGQRPLTHGVFLNDVPLAPDAVTLAKVFRRAGYDTGYIGKWHLNGDGRSAFIPPERRQGFDYWKALECTHNYNHSFYYGDGPEKLLWDGYDAIAQTRDAQQYLRDHAHRDKPFFLVLAWGPPHDPYTTAPAQYRALYHTNTITLRSNVPPSTAARARTALAGYYAHCSALDDCVGDLMETLRATGLEQNTLVIFTADHGDLLGSHGGFNKQQPYDESIRVPLLLRWPNGLDTAGRQLDAVISSEDIMPTLLGLCRVPIPKTVEGLDYSAYARGGQDPSDGSALIACPAPFGQWDHRHGGREYRGLRTRRYTYVRDLNGPWLLFDDQADPFQTRNLVNDPAHAKIQAELQATLDRKLKQTGDAFLPASAYIQKWHYVTDANGTVRYDP